MGCDDTIRCSVWRRRQNRRDQHATRLGRLVLDLVREGGQRRDRRCSELSTRRPRPNRGSTGPIWQAQEAALGHDDYAREFGAEFTPRAARASSSTSGFVTWWPAGRRLCPADGDGWVLAFDAAFSFRPAAVAVVGRSRGNPQNLIVGRHATVAATEDPEADPQESGGDEVVIGVRDLRRGWESRRDSRHQRS